MRTLAPLLRLALVAALAAVLAPACSLGNGTGSCSGTLDVPDCWAGPFDLHPDFFAAVPTADTDSMQLRIQHGGDYETFSDGLIILVDDAGEVRGDPTSTGTPRPSLLGPNSQLNSSIAAPHNTISKAQAQARAVGPAGVSNRRTPSGVVSDRRPSSKSGLDRKKRQQGGRMQQGVPARTIQGFPYLNSNGCDACQIVTKN